MSLRVLHRATCLLVFVLTSTPGFAHKLAPTATAEERAITDVRGGWLAGLERKASTWALHTFGEAVHEEITNRIFGCDGSICAGPEATHAPPAVLAGIRWNDDPPFRINSGEGRKTTCKITQTIRFQTQPSCWALLFRDASERAAHGARFDGASGAALLYRTHFGDLQFLHSMASKDGERAIDTQRAALDWSQFTWRIMAGEFTNETALATVPVSTMSLVFAHSAWTVQDLFTLGSPRLRREIRDVAFGSLLHTLEDSFAEGHVERATALASQRCAIGGVQYPAPGAVIEFHSYGNQDHALHAESDSQGALQEHLQETPDVVEIGRALRNAYESGTPWSDVEPFFSCIYALSPHARSSSSGANYASSGR